MKQKSAFKDIFKFLEWKCMLFVTAILKKVYLFLWEVFVYQMRSSENQNS